MEAFQPYSFLKLSLILSFMCNKQANTDDEDDNWWMAVEQTASHAELMYCS